VLREVRQLVVRMAEENSTWGYTRIRGALKNLGHRVGRSTIARILKAQGIPPVPERPTSWQTFLRAHWGAIAGADFFTTEVWTWRGLVTYYTVFVIDLASRRVQIVGSTPHPDDQFMRQIGRMLTAADLGMLFDHRVLICDRDRKTDGVGSAVPGRVGDPSRADAVPGLQCQCLCGTIRALDQTRVSRSDDSVRRVPSTAGPGVR
jgi:HTH-like domain